MKNYLEVTVFVSPGKDGAYTVRVESIEAGAGEYPLTLPFALGDLAGVVFGVVDVVERGQPLPSSRRASVAKSDRNFGAELFEALFKGPGLEVLAGTISRARVMIDTGVRIRFSMNLQDSGMVEVAGLPWELMSRRDDDPLVVSDKTPLVRSFDVLQPSDVRPLNGKLRILVVMSNPKDTPPLNLDAERAQIERSWKNMTVDFVRPVRAELRRQLAGADYHVVHFMGHGGFDAKKGGVLLLEMDDAERSQDPVSGQEFAVMLADEPLRLVYLNACQSGVTGIAGGGPSVHPFAGVASALIKKGVPAVVAMQFPISDAAAIQFATTFYERIAQTFPVDAAVSQARSALYADGHAEWVTPVLYLRSKDGLLFDTPSSQFQDAPAAAMAGADAWGAGSAEAPRIFLATPCKELKSLHQGLAAELRADGNLVVDAVPHSGDAAADTAAVRALAARADLCVHLMGDTPGKSLDGGGLLRTYPVEQLRIALESARSQLVIMPDVEIDTIEDADYQKYLSSLTTRSYDAHRFELVRTSKLEVKAAITANLKRQKDARQASTQGAVSGAVQTAFVDSHDIDQEVASELVTFLSQRDVEAFMQTSEGSSQDTLTQFSDNLKNYPLYILVSGKADKAWVTERTNSARSSAVAERVARHLLTVRESRRPAPKAEAGFPAGRER